MDELKKHIQQRLGEMDIDEPSEKSWEHIQSQLFAPKMRVIAMPVRWAVAACVVLLAGIGLVLFNQKSTDSVVVNSVKKEDKGAVNEATKNNPSPKVNINNTDTRDTKAIVSSIQKEKNRKTLIPAKKYLVKSSNNSDDVKALENLESSFTQVINMERNRINTTPLTAEDPGYFRDFGKQIAMMENDEAAVKKEIKKHGITDGLIDRLINIYQQKLNVLKQLQKEMQKTNNRYKQGRTAEDMPKLYFLNI